MTATPPPLTLALVVAGGRGSRAGTDTPKQYVSLLGAPVLRRTLDALLHHPAIDGVKVVIHADDRALYDAAVAGLDLMNPVIGGDTRQASVLNGLEALADTPADVVLIHDAARP
ncbi:MAG: 2-C-methyl-D-erythritol 4-phosphate cytidylyltransferase, partial [Sphingomonadales bacterium]